MHTDYTLHLLLLSPRRLLSLPPVSSSSSSASSRLLSAVSQTQTSVTSILTATHPAEQACVASSPNSRGGLHWRCLIPPHCQRNSAPSTRASISGTKTYGYACSLTLPYLTLRYLPTPLLPHASQRLPSRTPPTAEQSRPLGDGRPAGPPIAEGPNPIRTSLSPTPNPSSNPNPCPDPDRSTFRMDRMRIGPTATEASCAHASIGERERCPHRSR